ncbi:monovalent cation/H(+) antiporter subunit G [Pseudahrensia aquimaris]|uniref:Monovalent cation/H(+) antiporter subunit G n=1 Tax=Pseudahrensia aquimaris TaxID=744461 RepID=A0ABW3FG04_9HYPH
MIALVADVIAWACILAGGFFLVIGSLGMVRFPDFWSRLHAASVIDSAGIGLLLLGMMVHSGFTMVTVKLVLIVVFLFITGPTATHAVANAAFISGSRPKDMVEDETTAPEPLRKSRKVKVA